jgi:hypothetical protein
MRTSIVLVTELAPHHADWRSALAQAERLTGSLEPRLGLSPRVRLASLPPDLSGSTDLSGRTGSHDLAGVLAEEAAAEGEIFLLPTMLDFGLVQRARLAEIAAGIRLEYHRSTVAYDDVAFDSRPLIQALSERPTGGSSARACRRRARDCCWSRAARGTAAAGRTAIS